MRPWVRRLLIGIAIAVVLAANIALGLRAWIAISDRQTTVAQEQLDPFYAAPDPLPGPPGTLIRSEPLGVDVPGATALRILYVTERPDGTPAVSGGMVFIPDTPAPAEGRPVVAWAHPTVGMGDSCAPSRSANPLLDTDNWLDQMMQLGWVVTATDYAGLGTTGPELYLVGQAEARDVVNSVRALRDVPDARPGTSFAVWGHSQGGHSALWTGQLARELAPELTLVGTAAAAPAARLVDIMQAQWDTAVAWVIGPEVAISWPAVDPSLDPASVLTDAGKADGTAIADRCITQKALMLDVGALRVEGKQFFATDPIGQPAWQAFAQGQSPATPPAGTAVFIAQGTADEVVLPWPNAILQQQWCQSGVDLSMLWLGGVDHMKAAITAGPAAVEWIAGRFAGRPAPRTCDVPPPVAARNPTGG
ncbi:MAG: lipase family protein [Actinomycetales bacterium]|nr:lipase family protein [Actinomycetales bacterium]